MATLGIVLSGSQFCEESDFLSQFWSHSHSALSRRVATVRCCSTEAPDESEAATAPSAALQREINVSNVSILLKQRSHIFGFGTEG